MTTNITKSGTWRRGFKFTSPDTDVTITIDPEVRRNGNIRSYTGWVHGVPNIGPSTPANPRGLGRVLLGCYKPCYKQMLMDRIESILLDQYMGGAK